MKRHARVVGLQEIRNGGRREDGEFLFEPLHPLRGEIDLLPAVIAHRTDRQIAGAARNIVGHRISFPLASEVHDQLQPKPRQNIPVFEALQIIQISAPIEKAVSDSPAVCSRISAKFTKISAARKRDYAGSRCQIHK